MIRTRCKLLSVIALAAIVVFMLIGIGKHNYDPNCPTGQLKVLISDTTKQTTLLSLTDNLYIYFELKAGTSYRLLVEQDDNIFHNTTLYIKGDKPITVWGSDQKGLEISIPLSSYESVYIQSEIDTNISLSVNTYNKEISKQVFYVNDIHYLSNLNNYIDNTKDIAIVLIDDIISSEDNQLIITEPCEIYSNGFNINLKADLIVDYTSEKPFVIHTSNSKQISAKEFYANTPNAEVTIDNIFFSDEPNYCINAKVFNGKIMSKEINLNSSEKLIKLFDVDYYPKLYPDTILNIYDITIDKDVLNKFYGNVKDNIYINVPVNINILGNFKLDNVKLLIESYAESNIRINIFETGFFNYDNLEINAPLCSLVWVNNPPDTQYVSKYMNVLEYQGKELNSEYGGTGKGKIISFNSNTKVDLDWVIKGNAIETTIPFSISDADLENTIVSFDTDYGEAKIDETYVKNGKVNLNEAPKITVLDDIGNKRVYTISVIREKCDLPVIYINTEYNKEIVSDAEYIRATFEMDADHTNSDYTINTCEIDIKGRGNSTWRLFGKKPYRIKFETKTTVLGLPANKDWVLLANYADQSLIRNYVATEMGKKLDNLKFTPSSYPVDVFINGEYMGVYTIGEQIEVAKNRVNIDEDYNNPDTGYLLEIGGTDNVLQLGRDFFHCNIIKWVAIKSPDTFVMSKEHYKFISEYTKSADKAVQDKANYNEYIDIDSVIDWTILHEFTCNLDSGFRRSCFLYKEKGGKLYMGPAWDFDLAFGNYFRDYSYDTWFTCGGETLGTTWTTHLYEDPAFNKLLKDRWNSIKKDLKETAINSINSGSKMVYESQKYNFNKWNKLLGQKTSLQPERIKDFKTYDEHIVYLTQFVNSRYEWLDKAFNNLP